MVGRPRQFDEDETLEKAMTVFWANGFEATSMADLVKATGLHKGSIYQAFGNKHQLFLAALNRYLGEMRAHKNAVLESAETPLDAMREVLHGMLEMADDDAVLPRGCMAINALVEMAPHDPEVKAVMKAHLDQMRGSMLEVVAKAQEAGQMRSDRPPELITGLMMTFMSGLATQLKGPLTKTEAHQLLDEQINALL